MVRELSGFFTDKLQVIQGTLKILSKGVEPCIPSILDATNVVRYWEEQSASFDNILTKETIVAVFEDMSNSPFHALVDSLIKAEINLNFFIVESKEIMDARWTKATQDLQEVNNIDWPTKREIYVWEVVGEIKALLAEGS